MTEGGYVASFLREADRDRYFAPDIAGVTALVLAGAFGA